jgi:hypothetical protein
MGAGRKVLVVMLAAASLSACAGRVVRNERVSSACERPAPSVGVAVSLTARVESLAKDDFQICFDDFGITYSSIRIAITDPPEWRGIRDKVYYQGEPALHGKTLAPGDVVTFVATASRECLDSPWLYLSDLD